MTSAFMAIRLSHKTDESTSPKRQTEQTQRYCDLRGCDIAHVASNLDVSGGISPWQRSDLGKWLTEPELIARWDVLVIARPARLTRSFFDFADRGLPMAPGWLHIKLHGDHAHCTCPHQAELTAPPRVLATCLGMDRKGECEDGSRMMWSAAEDIASWVCAGVASPGSRRGGPARCETSEPRTRFADGRSESNRVGPTAVGAPSGCGPHPVWMTRVYLL
jgi:hypothetical protein